MYVNNPDGTREQLYIPGNNRARAKDVRAFEKQLVDEGAPNWNASTLPARLEVGYEKGTTPTANAATPPTHAAHAAELKAFIQTKTQFGEYTELLEAKLRELEALAGKQGNGKKSHLQPGETVGNPGESCERQSRGRGGGQAV